MNTVITVLDVYLAMHEKGINYEMLASAGTVSSWTQFQREAVIMWCQGKRDKPGFFRVNGSVLPPQHETDLLGCKYHREM